MQSRGLATRKSFSSLGLRKDHPMDKYTWGHLLKITDAYTGALRKEHII